MVDRHINSITYQPGKTFDAVSAILGIRTVSTFEGEGIHGTGGLRQKKFSEGNPCMVWILMAGLIQMKIWMEIQAADKMKILKWDTDLIVKYIIREKIIARLQQF